jgi:pyridinium-3,5-biscarboxylic acid mononucleotide sulfurtransferase
LQGDRSKKNDGPFKHWGVLIVMRTEANFSRLVTWFADEHDRAIVALSGGVDSAVVALAAKEALGGNAIAATADYATLSKEELESASNVAREIDINHIIIKYNELANEKFVRNDKLRCFYCRTELAAHLASEASRRNILLITDGTNLDDLNDYRPGIRAMREYGIRSPLVELGMNKFEIRSIAKNHDLSVYNKPSNSCLASRIPHGISVTEERLRRIEMSELVVKSIFPLRKVRVRDHSDLARIEVEASEIPKLFNVQRLELLNSRLKGLGFKYVTIDLQGYMGHDFLL